MHAFDMSIPPGRWVETEHEARQWIERYLRSSKPDMNNGLGLDTETTGIVRHKDIVKVWSLSDRETRICLDRKFLPLFREPILENPEINFDLTNAPFDAHMLANSGVDISKAGDWRDTKVQSWLFNENRQGRHGLKECTKEFFGRETPEFTAIFGKTKKVKGVEVISTSDLLDAIFNDPAKRAFGADYASLDAYNSTSLRHYFDEALGQIEMYPGMTLRDYFYQVEVPFTKVLWKMERRGFTVDAGYLRSLQGPMEKRLQEIEAIFAKEAGRLVKLQSTNDVRWFFFDHLNKTPIKLTAGGKTGVQNASTDVSVLETWAGQGDPWAKLLLEYRGIAKIHGTYVVGLQKWIDPHYRIHTSLNQTGTVTGRLSSSEPNLQNIPNAGDDVFQIREAFIPGFKKRLIVADWGQLEMRLMAHLSGDVKMIQAIKDGVDLHCLTVSEMYGIPYDEVIGAVKAEKALKKAHEKGLEGTPLTERQQELLFFRQGCKAAGFGIIYGIGGPGLAAQLTAMGDRIVTPEEGNILIKKWLNVFPGVAAYIESKKNQIWAIGYVQTILGRFRRFGDLKGMSKRDAAQCERQGVNAEIQGSAGDMAKVAMIKCEYDPVLKKYNAELLLQVHDELVLECDDTDEAADAVKQRVKEIMEDPFNMPFNVPMLSEVGSGFSWVEAK